MANKQLNGIYKFKQDTFDQMINEGAIDSSLYFVRDFDANGIPTSSSIYLGDRKYGEMCNDTIEGNDVEDDITNNGSHEQPFTPDELIFLNNTLTGEYYSKGYIVGQIEGVSNFQFAPPFSPLSYENGEVSTYQTNLLIANNKGETNPNKCVAVQLPSGILRDKLNLVQNPDIFGEELLIYGSLEKYYTIAGITAGIKKATYAKLFSFPPYVQVYNNRYNNIDNTEIYTDYYKDDWVDEGKICMIVECQFNPVYDDNIEVTIERSEKLIGEYSDQYQFGSSCILGNGELTQIYNATVPNIPHAHKFVSHIYFPKDSSKNITIKYTFNDGVSQPTSLTIHYVYNPT